MRVFAGGVGTETNTFSPIPTGLADFDVVRPPEDPTAVIYGSTMNVFRQLSEARGWDFTFGLYAFAQPAGTTVRSAYESLRDELLARLQQTMPVDIVFLMLHGAMVAEGYDDCETDIIQRVRAIVGPAAKIGVELDLHCDITQESVDLADAIVLFKEYPHIDVDTRARDLFTIIADAAEGKINPTMALFDCRMLGTYLTPFEPMRSFVDGMSALEGRDSVLSVSLAHSFPWADVPTTGAYTLVITDNQPATATQVAEMVGRKLFKLRHTVTQTPSPMLEVLDQALAVSGQSKPVVLADTADNAGGGAPSDSTFILRELLQRGMTNAGVAMMWDPVVVQLAHAAGAGAKLQVRLGGKMGPMSGDPLDLAVTVKAVARDLWQNWPQQTGALTIACGDAACLTCEGIDIIVNAKRTQVLGTEAFTNFGVDIQSKRLLVVKSSQHFYAAYAPIAAAVFYAGGPGSLTRDFPAMPYRRVNTHKYPWLDDPFAG
jgi:microcystin degradation protein MlrC